jgi:hypothetical protein
MCLCSVRGIPPEKAWACLKTTQRYAHLSQYTLLAAANAATVAVGAVMLPPVMMAPVSALLAALRA